MSLGTTPATEDLFKSSRDACEPWLSEDSIYRILHREGARLFPDEAFSDRFARIGRSSIPPQIVAVVMVLQRIEGLSDREAVERFRFDLRWKYAAGGLDFDYAGFVHTVLVDPDSEIITATEVTAANAGDAEPAESLLDDMLGEEQTATAPAEQSQSVGDGDQAGLAESEPVESSKKEVSADAPEGRA